MNDITKVINKLYDKKGQGFFTKYGSDLIIALIIIYIFLVWTTYYYVLNHLPLIKANWAADKCHPLYLPFAGIIVDDKNKSKLELINNNFEGCVQNILTSITAEVLKPIYYTTNLLTSSFNEVTHATTGIRSMFNKVRVDMENTTENISGRTLNITAPILKLIISAKNMMGQTIGTITAAIYTLFGSYLTLNSLLGSIIEFIGIILGAIAAAIVAALFIPFIGEAIAAPLIALETAILVPFLIIVIAVNNIFHTHHSLQSTPSACFGKYTPIKMANNTTKNICDIIIGDILHDGSIITGTMHLSSYSHTIFNLNNIIVTGLHRVYHDTNGWIKVSDHPHSYQINDYRENILYCLNTSTKTIKINNYTFSDWDDLDDTDLTEINNKCKFLPKCINNKDIHKYLDNGLDGNTLIEMEVGTQVKIKQVEVNDILRFGERVLGIIQIDAKDILSINEYKINKIIIRCSNNIQLYDENLGNLNTNNLEGIPIIDNKYLYQLITDKGFYYIGNLKVYDYNIGIEKYLDNTEFYPQNLYQ